MAESRAVASAAKPRISEAAAVRKALNTVSMPALRFGWLVQARSQGHRYVVSRHSVDNVITNIMSKKNRQLFDAEIGNALKTSGWRVVRYDPAHPKKLARIKKSVGATIDLDEIEIQDEEGTILVIRCCMTVCVDPRAGRSEGEHLLYVDDSDVPSSSKFWVRVFCIQFKGQDPDNLDFSGMNALAKRCEPLASSLAASLSGPYEGVMSELAPREARRKLKIELREELFLFVASTTAPGFHQLYYDVLSCQQSGFAPGSCLDGMKTPAVHLLKDMKKRFSFMGAEGAPKLFAFEDELTKARAIYWTNVHENGARLVGLASDPYFEAAAFKELDPYTRLRKSPGSTMNVATSVAIASKL